MNHVHPTEDNSNTRNRLSLTIADSFVPSLLTADGWVGLLLFVGSMVGVLGIRKTKIKAGKGIGRELGSLVLQILSLCLCSLQIFSIREGKAFKKDHLLNFSGK